MLLSDAIQDYLNHLRHERGVTQTTFITYQNRLNNFMRWLEANGYPAPRYDTYCLPVLRQYLYFLSKKGNRPRTIRGCFNALRGFGTFLVEVGVIEANPAAKVTLPKLDAAQRLTITEEEVKALFEACERQRTERQISFSRAILSILCYAGLRRAEVYNLRLSDVNLNERSILVRSGKGMKSRRVFVCTDAVDALRAWLAVREPDCKHDWLFAYDKSRRIHDEGIATLLETLKATAGLRDNDAIKPHGLRHWCATNLLRNGANLRDVQQFLGHSDIVTTSRYLHSNEEQLRGISELTAIRPKSKNAPQKALPDNERSRPIRRVTR